MTFMKLDFRPGVNRETTDYANAGGWYDCNLVRFRQGRPERMGGWVKVNTVNQLVGTGRSLFPWVTLNGEQLYGIGTHLKYFISQGGGLTDVTPVRRDVTLGTNPITTVGSGSAVIEVADPGNGSGVGDYVTLSGVVGAVDGIPEAELNAEHIVTSVTSANAWQATVSTVATTGGVAGGGTAVKAEYQITIGLNTTVVGLGYGSDTYGAGGYGDSSGSLTVGNKLRLWDEDNFGEDLLMNVRDGGVYHYDVSVATRGTALSALTGSSSAPTVARQLIVSNNDRHVIAFACDDIGSVGTQDLLLIRWSDQESVINWDQTPETTAGSMRLNGGSEIVAAVEAQEEILVFTDTTLHSLRYIGDPYTFGQQIMGSEVSLIGPNAVIADGSVSYWMGADRFYRYTGTIEPMRSTVEEYIFGRLNKNQGLKVMAGLNKGENEVIWLYPSTDGQENDSYVIFNYVEDVWYYGAFARTAWHDRHFDPYPTAIGADGYVYYHDNGCDDGENEPATALNPYIESSDFELANGDRLMLINRLVPDVTFDGSSNASPSVTITLTPRDYPGEAYDTGDAEASVVTRSAVLPVEQYTKLKNIRIRGRALKYRIESTALGVFWRQGSPRIDARPDGRR